VSEYRRLYWHIRDVGDAAVLSRTHLFPEDRQTALCGRKWPRDKESTVQWDEIIADHAEVCRECVKAKKRVERSR
jgi:hypothetical protein